MRPGGPRPGPARIRFSGILTRYAAALRAALVLCAVLAFVASGCGGSHRSARPDARAPTGPFGPSGPTGPEGPPVQRLPIGIAENNPQLITPDAVPPAFAAWRDSVAQLHPARYRLLIDWATLQGDPGVPADLSQPNDGCLRGLGPCGPYAGIRDSLRAIAARQRADGGGWAVVVSLYGVPPWAAAPPYGCERTGTGTRSRPITEAGLLGYRALIRAVLALGREEGVVLRWWSPWNEPNHPAFVSPQRAACTVRSPTLAPGVYTGLVRAARAELATDRDPHELVLGELAGYGNPIARGTGISEFIRALPDDVACAGTVWSQHEYAQPGGGQPDAVGELEHALDERPCTAGKPIWVTETAVGGRRAGLPRPAGLPAQAHQCAAMATLLEAWDRDSRVRAVFQFSIREDTAYPVGLVDSGLTRAYPTFALWRAWGSAPPGPGGVPARPAGCDAR